MNLVDKFSGLVDSARVYGAPVFNGVKNTASTKMNAVASAIVSLVGKKIGCGLVILAGLGVAGFIAYPKFKIRKEETTQNDNGEDVKKQRFITKMELLVKLSNGNFKQPLILVPVISTLVGLYAIIRLK